MHAQIHASVYTEKCQKRIAFRWFEDLKALFLTQRKIQVFCILDPFGSLAKNIQSQNSVSCFFSLECNKFYYFLCPIKMPNASHDTILLNHENIFTFMVILLLNLFLLTFNFEIIIDSQEVAKIVQREPMYPSPSFPRRWLHLL